MICVVDGCDKPVRDKANELCNGHSHRLVRYGSPTGKPESKPKQSCTVDGCQRKFYGKGFCVKHYKRWRKYGDPLGGGIDYGDAQTFMISLAGITCDECVAWPFGKTKDGYGRIRWKGVSLGAHVVAATLSHGEKPTPKHEACHTCGNGHLGCVNPRHLYWGTRADNVADAMAHGTAFALNRSTGEYSPNAKFSDAVIADARARMAAGETAQSVARDLGIGRNYIYLVRDGKFRNGSRPANDNNPQRSVA